MKESKVLTARSLVHRKRVSDHDSVESCRRRYEVKLWISCPDEPATGLTIAYDRLM